MTSSETTPTTEAQFAVINTKLDQILARDTDHEDRIRKLERWQYIATGLAASLGSGVGATVASLLR